jgi:DNA-binding response OmpR family regulator
MRRMLIVEDERDLSDCLHDFFSAKGFAVASAFSGEEALEQLKQESPDVILLDILLPGLSGIEVLKRVKELHPTARVVMVSSVDHMEIKHQAHRYGAVGYVTKPFDFSEETWAPVFIPPT